jgi:hypothetical protein
MVRYNQLYGEIFMLMTDTGDNLVPTPNPKQAMGDAKIQLQLVPSSVEIAIARGLVEGARKYGAWNWRDQPVQVMTYVGSLKRHLAAWIEGEDIDPDGGKLHLDGAIASLAIIIDAISSGSALDDRPKVKDGGTTDALSNKKESVFATIQEWESKNAS